MKFIKVLLKITLPLILIAITISYSAEDIIKSTVTNEVMSKKISGYVLDDVINEFDLSKLGDIEDKIRNSKYTEEISKKYVDVFINNVLYDKKEKLDISNEVNLLIEKELGNELSDEKKAIIQENLKTQSEKLEKRIEEYVPSGFTNYDFKGVLKIYNIIISEKLRTTLFALLFVNILILIILDKKRSAKVFRNIFFITCILSVALFGVIRACSNYINMHYAGGWFDEINEDVLLKFILVYFIISVIMYALDMIIGHTKKKKLSS